ncbi:right-handed parallel beta-helix repeat-containing protein [Paenibacillus sp. P22]|uniref:right-handed parallel beta-helix repeat-containing protein n=1 Tax=Paenibacillus sp. P22 TaxID=483908 RepID=UPI000436521D|nr:right-handed parallel beta-helix repeat-containing protein [Paenibacillus sp. P22]CDN41438.1 Putative uncharacterized protein [Paenibacillus sp. P22]
MATKKTVNMKLNDWNTLDVATTNDLSGNFVAIDSEFAVRGINANWQGAKGDNMADDTNALIALFNTVKTGDTLIFPPRSYYKTNRAGFLYTFTGKHDLQIEGNGATIEVADQGFSFTFTNGISVSNLKLVRANQAVWGSGKTGMYFGSCTKVDVSRVEISKFTDGIALSECQMAKIYKNTLHHLGEEPIVSRTSLQVTVEANEAYAYLGDGILNKGTQDMTIERNYLHDPVNKDIDSSLWSSISGSSEAPLQGGGITCNAESGTYPNDNMTIVDNRIIGTIYGVILSGISIAKVTKNRITNTTTTGITVSDSTGFNPNSIPAYDIDISYNYIRNVNPSTPRAVIQFKAGAIPVNYAAVSYNRVYPNGPHKAISVGGEVEVIGNTIKGAEQGIELLDGASASNNIILEAFQTDIGRAISMYNNTSAIDNTIKSSAPVILWGNNAIVSQNTIINNSSINVAVLVQTNARGNQIINNTISSTALKEISAINSDWRDKNTYYGWISRGGSSTYIPPALSRVSIRPTSVDLGRVPGAVFFDTNLNNSIVWSGAKWIESNSGRAVLSGDGVTVTLSLPHGLSTRPTAFFAIPASTDAGIAKIRNIDVNDSSILIRFETAPAAGTNNVVVTWYAESK